MLLRLVVIVQLFAVRLADGCRRRIAVVRDPTERDRGDIVQTVIIVAVMAGAAIAVLGVIVAIVNHWGAKIPDTNQNPNG